MSNKSSPHGGFISEGTIVHGTLIPQDLLRAFARELNRVLPFNCFALVQEALGQADILDAVRASADDTTDEYLAADEIITDLMDNLQAIAARENLYFGAHEGDGSDFGYWTAEND